MKGGESKGGGVIGQGWGIYSIVQKWHKESEISTNGDYFAQKNYKEKILSQSYNLSFDFELT